MYVIDYNTTESKHLWDDGKRGNFWSDYNGTDANGDGIGDTPYVIDVLNEDRYPLVASSVIPPTVTADIHVEFALTAIVLAAIVIVAVVTFRKRKKKGNQKII